MFIKPEPHQLISNTQMMEGRICYDWLVSHLSLWCWIYIFHAKHFLKILYSNVKLLPFPPKCPNFLIFSLTSPPACLPSQAHAASPFRGACLSVSSRLRPGRAPDAGSWFFKFFSCSSYFFRHGHLKYIHHPCISQYLAKDIDASFVRLHLRQVPASMAHIAYLAMLTPFSAMPLFYA